LKNNPLITRNLRIDYKLTRESMKKGLTFNVEDNNRTLIDIYL